METTDAGVPVDAELPRELGALPTADSVSSMNMSKNVPIGRELDSSKSVSASDTEAGDGPAAAARPAAHARKVRLHEVWPGSNRIFCCGLFMSGSPGRDCATSTICWQARRECCNKRSFCGKLCDNCIAAFAECSCIERPCCMAMSGANASAWCCILVPSGVWFWFAMPYYWTSTQGVFPLVILFCFFLTVFCLLAASFSDPGVIPRREVVVATKSVNQIQKELGYNVLGQPSQEKNRRGDDGFPLMMVPADLRGHGYRWCNTCRIIKPPRASHCSDCDNCVMRFDHHCPFVNNCVGQRNYLFFMGFISSVCCLALLVIPSLLWFVEHDKSSSDHEREAVDRMKTLQAVLLTAAAAFGLAAVIVVGLWAYHIFLICSGMTTKEHWKGRKSGSSLPGYGEKLTVFARRGPKLFNLLATVEADAIRESGDASRKWWLPPIKIRMTDA